VLLSDDVDDNAFLEFSAARNAIPAIVVKPYDGQRVAMIRVTADPI
jgi:hypothetical protein